MHYISSLCLLNYCIQSLAMKNMLAILFKMPIVMYNANEDSFVLLMYFQVKFTAASLMAVTKISELPQTVWSPKIHHLKKVMIF